MPLKLKTRFAVDADVMKAVNLCSRIDEDDLKQIGQWVKEGYLADEFTRTKWLRRNEAGMDFALQIQKDKNWPWQGCSNVIFPLITIAAMQYSSRAYSNIVNGTDVVRVRVAGPDPTGALQARADRISTHMSYQVLEEDEDWEDEKDAQFMNQAIVGTNFTKSYFSGEEGHNISELVLARDLVMNYYAKSVEKCPRKTHLIQLFRNDVHGRIKRGTFKDITKESWYQGDTSTAPTSPSAASAQYAMAIQRKDNRQGLTPPQPDPQDSDPPFQFYEQHVSVDFDHDGYAEPYIITVEASSACVVRVVARWDEESQVERTANGDIICIRSTEYFTKYGFIKSPDKSIYDIGFGVLLGPLNESVNTSINQLLDSGTMQNSLGGFLGRGAKIRGGEYSMAPWEWKRVDSTGDDLRKSIVPYPDRQPSAVLFNLLSLLIEYTNRISSTTDIMVGKAPGQNTPAETSRNTLEQGMQIFSTIFKRTWRSMKKEFKKLHRLNAIYLPQTFSFGSGADAVRKEDYTTSGEQVVPSADPNVTSLSMRFFQAQSIRQASRESPGYDVKYVERNFLKAMRVEALDRFYPGPDKVPPPEDPKMAITRLQLQYRQMELMNQRQEWIISLMEQRRLNNAQIIKLQADAAAAVAGIDERAAALRLQHLELAMNAMQQLNDTINERLKLLADDQQADMSEVTSEQQQQQQKQQQSILGAGGGSIPEMEGGPDDTDSIPTAEDLAGGAEGSME